MIPPIARARTGRPFHIALGHGETEPFEQALLDDDGGVALQGVDHDGVLVAVIHRHGDQGHQRLANGRAAAPRGPTLG